MIPIVVAGQHRGVPLVEQIINYLREAEVFLAQGQIIGEICRRIGVSGQSYYRWRREYGGLKVDQALLYSELFGIAVNQHRKAGEQAGEWQRVNLIDADAPVIVRPPFRPSLWRRRCAYFHKLCTGPLEANPNVR